MWRNILELTRWGSKRQGAKDITMELDMAKLPKHIAIIMDGNGRWATRRGLPRAMGHRAGVESLRDIVRTCSQLGIGFLTVYAFSTENWKRPAAEVDVLMDLIVEYLANELDELDRNNVRIKAVGRLSELPEKAREALFIAENKTAANSGLNFNIALNYGGRIEIVDAVKRIALEVSQGRIEPADIDEETFSDYLYTAGMPEPDLLIRPSGELRISNFLLWQCAYSEFWFSSVFWPDFRKDHLLEALVDYQNRQRRFGGLKQTR